jgi:hypothetical protein
MKNYPVTQALLAVCIITGCVAIVLCFAFSIVKAPPEGPPLWSVLVSGGISASFGLSSIVASMYE